MGFPEPPDDAGAGDCPSLDIRVHALRDSEGGLLTATAKPLLCLAWQAEVTV